MVIMDPRSKDCEGLTLCKNLTTTVFPASELQDRENLIVCSHCCSTEIQKYVH